MVIGGEITAKPSPLIIPAGAALMRAPAVFLPILSPTAIDFINGNKIDSRCVLF